MEERREVEITGSSGIKTMIGESPIEASQEQVIDAMFESLSSKNI